ncbi:hypothetical protein Mp_7g17390 [Marchantia polymorpha subsp. ruderalis]|uniref:Uncharacterized protein n=2 Tax=Marchantia polymorpha TaxID=3197 RepID=A0AAF6C0R6_MARPO|nr:hypothetical protein MARPO_0051s0076 [Marchantia polymorpha]BBN17850.1 hypothetical protein Mp_7g17390 [Marchantia polymorpha subsp. ruderalis]|eukprot:PTQ38475.1 hypothetical protein MARPO_0051s0076 [Marchantia polymorpha]
MHVFFRKKWSTHSSKVISTTGHSSYNNDTYELALDFLVSQSSSRRSFCGRTGFLGIERFMHLGASTSKCCRWNFS